MKYLTSILRQFKRWILSIVNRSLFIIYLWGTPNYYKGIDKPTFWQWLYKWRTSFNSAIEVDKMLHS